MKCASRLFTHTNTYIRHIRLGLVKVAIASIDLLNALLFIIYLYLSTTPLERRSSLCVHRIHLDLIKVAVSLFLILFFGQFMGNFSSLMSDGRQTTGNEEEGDG